MQYDRRPLATPPLRCAFSRMSASGGRRGPDSGVVVVLLGHPVGAALLITLLASVRVAMNQADPAEAMHPPCPDPGIAVDRAPCGFLPQC